MSSRGPLPKYNKLHSASQIVFSFFNTCAIFRSQTFFFLILFLGVALVHSQTVFVYALQLRLGVHFNVLNKV